MYVCVHIYIYIYIYIYYTRHSTHDLSFRRKTIKASDGMKRDKGIVSTVDGRSFVHKQLFLSDIAVSPMTSTTAADITRSSVDHRVLQLSP